MSAAETMRERLDQARGEGLEVNLRRFLRFRGEHYPLEVQALKMPGRWPENRNAYARDEGEAVRLATEAETWGAMGSYVVTHNIKPAIASRAEPGRWHTMPKGASTTNNDICDRLVLYVDVDPERPPGIGATDAEVSTALEVGAEILDRLRGAVGDDGPLAVGFSGNGVGLFVALEALPESSEVQAIVSDALEALHILHSRPGVAKVDLTVKEAKRLSPLWGTTKCKGWNDPERPHRSTGFDDLGGCTRRLSLAELRELRDKLVSALTPEQRAELDKKARKPPHGGEPSNDTGKPRKRKPNAAYEAAKAVDVRDLMGRLGRVENGRPICPGCGEGVKDTSVAFVGNGLKCSHNRCAEKGAPGAPGFRTTIDLVVEHCGVSAREAVKMLGEWYGFDGSSKASRAYLDDDPDDDRPQIHMSAELGENVDEAIAALAGDPDVYQRGGELVTIVTPEGEGPRIDVLTVDVMRDRLGRCARFLKYDARSESWRRAVPSDHILRALLGRKRWASIRPLSGIIEAPTLRPDGSILDRAGYDAATGYVYAPAADFPPVPVEPTREDALRALSELGGVFCDFPYRQDSDIFTAIAAVLTILARPGIRGAVPSFVFEASTRGSGKSLQTNVIHVITTGRGASMMNWPADDVELEKVLASYALMGARVVTFDNIDRPYGGGPLDRVLTAEDRVGLRILGRSEMRELSWRSVILATGNNVQIVGDTVRRVAVSRIEPKEENPEDRTDFLHPDLLAWVRAERPRLVVAALTILRAHAVAGRPMGTTKVWGSFEAWSAIVPAAIAWLGGVDLTEARPSAVEGGDPAKAALGVLLTEWRRHAPDGATAAGMIATAYAMNGETTYYEREELREAIEYFAPLRAGSQPSARTLTRSLISVRGRIVGGLSFVSIKSRGAIYLWRSQSNRVASVASVASS